MERLGPDFCYDCGHKRAMHGSDVCHFHLGASAAGRPLVRCPCIGFINKEGQPDSAPVALAERWAIMTGNQTFFGSLEEAVQSATPDRMLMLTGEYVFIVRVVQSGKATRGIEWEES